jgi:hypothetical protein
MTTTSPVQPNSLAMAGPGLGFMFPEAMAGGLTCKCLQTPGS